MLPRLLGNCSRFPHPRACSTRCLVLGASSLRHRWLSSSSSSSAPPNPRKSSAKVSAPDKTPAKCDSMLPKKSFDGKVVLVTGGAMGIGKGIATKLSELGATVAIMNRNRDVVVEAANEIQLLTNSLVIPLSADVRDPEQIKDALDELDDKAGLPTIVVNNAAGNFVSPFERLNPKSFGTVVDVVLKGTANVTLEAGKRMISADKGGVFLNITTTYAETGSGYVVPSAAAKAGVSAMVKSLAAEWGKYGIRFVGIAPGPIKSKGPFDTFDPSGAFEEVLRRNNPLGRFGEIEELANLATYLVSDYASWINGEIVRFDGGETVANSGEFNMFSSISKEKWDDMEMKARQANQSKQDAEEAAEKDNHKDNKHKSSKKHTKQHESKHKNHQNEKASDD